MISMKISDIRYGTRDIAITGKIIEVDEIREVKTKFGKTTVMNATIEDETGQIKLTLWGDQIDKIRKGNVMELEGGYVREFNGELFVNVGRNGKLEVKE
jgi:replication factor A1